MKNATREQVEQATQAFLAKGGLIRKLENSVSLSDEVWEMEVKSNEEDSNNIKSLSGDESISPEYSMFKN